MKCQKCGAEIPAGSKFCNECGTKIEQIALFKDSKPENAEPYKCEKCGNMIPSDSVFCPQCHAYQKNKFKPTSDTEKSSDKKPIYRTSHFYIALLIALILCAVVVTAISQVSQTKSQQSVTTSPNKAAQDISKTDSLKLYDVTPFSISIPEKWAHKTIDGHDYFYDSYGNMFYINASPANISQSQFDSGYVDSFLDGFADSFDDFEEINRTTTYIDDFSAYRVTANIKEFGDKFYGTIYVWATNNYLCSMIFSSKGNEQSEEFNLYENTIVESITIDSSKDEEDLIEKATELETEAPTKKPTEPETEPPTEKPTEFEDTLTELYSDNDITVYYSDTEQYPYSDDEADVHFYVKNKMGKSITIQADTVILDGRSYNNVVCSDPISAHSEGMIEVSIDNCKNFNPSTVGADLRYFDTDSYENDVKMNLVSKKVK